MTFVFLCVCFCGSYYGMLVEVRGQLVCVLSLLLSRGSQGIKLRSSSLVVITFTH